VEVEVGRVGECARLVVSDNGAGIDPCELPFLFDRFWQGERRPAHACGLGLGLPLVRHVLELHGGRISAESAGRDHGARFRIDIPALDARPPAAKPLLPAIARSAGVAA
jgi:signal transduction histidine kinase